MQIPIWAQTALLLSLSNIFMTFAWYGHLRTLNSKPWIIAALVSWGIALFEYMLMVPANRIGYTELTVAQLKIMQEVITLCVFMPFAVLFLHQPLKLDYLWAGLCLLGAVYLFSGLEPGNQTGGIPPPSPQLLHLGVELVYQGGDRQLGAVAARLIQHYGQILAHPVHCETEVELPGQHGLVAVFQLPGLGRALADHRHGP